MNPNDPFGLGEMMEEHEHEMIPEKTTFHMVLLTNASKQAILTVQEELNFFGSQGFELDSIMEMGESKIFLLAKREPLIEG